MAAPLRTALQVGVAAFCAFVLAVLIVAVVDLYLTGHGRRALTDRPLLDINVVNVHLSVADGFVLAFACAAGLLALVALRREG